MDHAFAHATFSEEVLFEPFDLLIEQVSRLAYQANDNVCHNLLGAGLNKVPIGLIGRIRLITKFPDIQGFAAVLILEPEITCAKEIPVIRKKFLKTCTRNIGKLDLQFLRCAGNLTSFDNILFTGSGSLYHLVAGAISL
jgi:hypothetical protein